jgi:ParB-like chromosome segregation protein Spo0J
MNETKELTPKAMAGNIPVYCAHEEIVPVGGVVPNPKNPNQHPEKQVQLLAQIIKAQGWRQPVTISRRSGFIVRGHGRYKAAL